MLCLSGLCIPILLGVDFFLVGQRRNIVGIVDVCFQSVLQRGVLYDTSTPTLIDM